jgi:hypothetical protein
MGAYRIAVTSVLHIRALRTRLCRIDACTEALERGQRGIQVAASFAALAAGGG